MALVMHGWVVNQASLEFVGDGGCGGDEKESHGHDGVDDAYRAIMSTTSNDKE